MLVARRSPNAIMPAPTVRVGEAVDQDEGAGLAVLGVGIEGDGDAGREIAEADLVEASVAAGQMLERVDVDLVLEGCDLRPAPSGAEPQQIGAAGQQRLFGHPQQMRGELIGDLGPRAGRDQNVAARDVDFVGQRQRHRIAGLALPRAVAVIGDDAPMTRDVRPRRRPRWRRPAGRGREATVPAKPRKSRLGRFTHCTGKRNGLARSALATSTVSR